MHGCWVAVDSEVDLCSGYFVVYFEEVGQGAFSDNVFYVVEAVSFESGSINTNQHKVAQFTKNRQFFRKCNRIKHIVITQVLFSRSYGNSSICFPVNNFIRVIFFYLEFTAMVSFTIPLFAVEINDLEPITDLQVVSSCLLPSTYGSCKS